MSSLSNSTVAGGSLLLTTLLTNYSLLPVTQATPPVTQATPPVPASSFGPPGRPREEDEAASTGHPSWTTPGGGGAGGGVVGGQGSEEGRPGKLVSGARGGGGGRGELGKRQAWDSFAGEGEGGGGRQGAESDGSRYAGEDRLPVNGDPDDTGDLRGGRPGYRGGREGGGGGGDRGREPAFGYSSSNDPYGRGGPPRKGKGGKFSQYDRDRFDEYGRALNSTQNSDESDPGAVMYIIVVLVFYSTGVMVMIVRYLRTEKKELEEEVTLENFFKSMPDKRAEKEHRVNTMAIRAFHTLTSISYEDDELEHMDLGSNASDSNASDSNATDDGDDDDDDDDTTAALSSRDRKALDATSSQPLLVTDL